MEAIPGQTAGVSVSVGEGRGSGTYSDLLAETARTRRSTIQAAGAAATSSSSSPRRLPSVRCCHCPRSHRHLLQHVFSDISYCTGFPWFLGRGRARLHGRIIFRQVGNAASEPRQIAEAVHIVRTSPDLTGRLRPAQHQRRDRRLFAGGSGWRRRIWCSCLMPGRFARCRMLTRRRSIRRSIAS